MRTRSRISWRSTSSCPDRRAASSGSRSALAGPAWPAGWRRGSASRSRPRSPCCCSGWRPHRWTWPMPAGFAGSSWRRSRWSPRRSCLMARSLAPDWPRRVVALLAAAVALVWAAPISQVAIIVGGALHRPLAARRAAEPAGLGRREPDLGEAGVACLVDLRRVARRVPAPASGRRTGGGAGRRLLPRRFARVRRRARRPAVAARERRRAGVGHRGPVPGRLRCGPGRSGSAVHVRGLPRRRRAIAQRCRGRDDRHWGDLPALVPARLRDASVLGSPPAVRRLPARP